jgi:hypothetical protein
VGASAPVKYHYFQRYFTYSIIWKRDSVPLSGSKVAFGHADPGGRHCQVGSLAGAAHLLKDNAGVLR